MKRRGINYDVGVFPDGEDRPSRAEFDSKIVRHEIEIIARDLHCNAIRIAGRDLERLATAATFALDEGLEVWLAPVYHNADERETLVYFAKAAQMAETLRQRQPNVVFLAGWELTFFMKGLVAGPTAYERIKTFMSIWRLLRNLVTHGSFNKRLNTFLAQAVVTVRQHFKGQISYAAGTWEEVDWTPFDYVSVDFYRDAQNATQFEAKLKKYLALGKPLILTEFGCCTYEGADAKGSYGWNVVDWEAQPPRLKRPLVRSEQTQAVYLTELIDIFAAHPVEGAFAYTFVAPKYPHRPDDPTGDLDMASYAVVKSYGGGQRGATYPDMPWEPKASFAALASRYAKLATERDPDAS